MNKKTKKQIQVLQQKIQKLQKQLAGARQHGERAEIQEMEQSMQAARQKLAQLKAES